MKNRESATTVHLARALFCPARQLGGGSTTLCCTICPAALRTLILILIEAR